MAQRKPTVAIAIACYNQAHYLGDAIESALEQLHPADEIIVVDDGSTDDTAAVSARYPVRYHCQDNAGLSAARNTGLQLASADRILFLDSDDVLMPTTLADGMRRFDTAPGVAFVYGGYREVTEDLDLIFEREAQEFPDAMAGLLLGNHVSMHGTVIYDARLLAASGGFDTTLKSCEDYDVFLRLARNHPIAAYHSIGADYRRHGGAMTVNHIRMMRLSREVVKRHLALPGLTAAQQKAGRKGLDFMTGYYVQCALAEVAQHLARVRHLIWGGLRSDPKFGLRVLYFGGVWLARKASRRFRRHETEGD